MNTNVIFGYIRLGYTASRNKVISWCRLSKLLKGLHIGGAEVARLSLKAVSKHAMHSKQLEQHTQFIGTKYQDAWSATHPHYAGLRRLKPPASFHDADIRFRGCRTHRAIL